MKLSIFKSILLSILSFFSISSEDLGIETMVESSSPGTAISVEHSGNQEIHQKDKKQIMANYLTNVLGVDICQYSDHQLVVLSGESCPGCPLAKDYCNFREKKNTSTILVYNEMNEGVPVRFRHLLTKDYSELIVDSGKIGQDRGLDIKNDSIVKIVDGEVVEIIEYSPATHSEIYSQLGI